MEKTYIYRGHLAMLFFSFLVAGSFSIGTRIANLMEPAALMAMRFAIAGAVVGICVALGPKIDRKHLRAPWRYLVLGGLFAIYFGLMFEGLKTAQPVSASAVFTLTPVMSAVFGYILLRQHMTAWMALALAIGAAGALWVIFKGDLSALMAFDVGRGEMIFFIGCISHALYTPMVRKLNRGEPAMVFTLGMILAAMFVFILFGIPELIRTEWAALPWFFWAGLFYIAICASAMTFYLLQFAVMFLPSAKVMAYTYLTPSWVILWELIITEKAPPIFILIGVMATIIALLMLLKNEE